MFVDLLIEVVFSVPLFSRFFQHVYKVEGVCFVGSIGRIGLVSFYEILGVFKQVFPTVDIEHDTVFVVSIR